jgi:[acyl-carrier-protein] S-malonyltransferase
MTRYAYLFPGQASQSPGMGQQLAQAFPESRAVFETADHVLERPLSELCFGGSPEELALTENTQPAILTVSVAALRALEIRGLRPAAAAGHSLGEYSAHVAAGTLQFSDAVRTVQARGRFMQEAVPVGEGAMAAILGLDAQRVDEICRQCAGGEVVAPANLNGPRQVVVAGHAAAVARAVEAAQSAGAKRAVSLPVSAPFHCSLMEPAAERLRPVLESIDFRGPEFPVFTNADAAAVEQGEGARQALLRQVAAPVRWHETIEAMLASGIETFVEVGPGKVLSGLLRGIRKGVPIHQVSDPEGVERVAKELGR